MKRIIIIVLMSFTLLISTGCDSNSKPSFKEEWESLSDFYTTEYIMSEVSPGRVITPVDTNPSRPMILSLDDRSFNMLILQELPSNTGVGTMSVNTEYIYYFETGLAKVYVDTIFSEYDVISDTAVLNITTNEFTFDGQSHVRTDRRRNLNKFIDLVRADIRDATGYSLEGFILD